MGSLASILWVVVVLLVVLWLLGIAAFHVAGWFIHLLLVLAVIIILYNLFAGRRTV